MAKGNKREYKLLFHTQYFYVLGGKTQNGDVNIFSLIYRLYDVDVKLHIELYLLKIMNAVFFMSLLKRTFFPSFSFS